MRALLILAVIKGVSGLVRVGPGLLFQALLPCPRLLRVPRVDCLKPWACLKPRGACPVSRGSRLLSMAEGVDSESCKGQSAAPPVLYAKGKSEWIEGSKAGFSIVADFGTADSVELPDGAIEPGDGPPRVKLPILLQLMDPGRFPTASAAKKKVRQGIILVNGRKARVDMLIKIGEDNIAMQSRTESKFKPLGEAPFHIDVIYEDDVMAVVHKPQGVCTHPPKGQTEAQSMMSMRCCVPYHVKCAPPGHEGILWRPMLVHRLDKATEGLQIVGKTKRAYVDLQRQFANRLIKKQYLALVEGNIEETEGTIDLMVDNKDAVSDFKVVKRVRSGGLGMLTLLHVFPRHGRKHQIRIHCADGLGCSILGDPRHRGTLVGHGLFLAAIGLHLTHPITCQPLHVTLPYPDRFSEFMHDEEAAWERSRHDGVLLAHLQHQADSTHRRLSRGQSAEDDDSEEEVTEALQEEPSDSEAR